MVCFKSLQVVLLICFRALRCAPYASLRPEPDLWSVHVSFDQSMNTDLFFGATRHLLLVFVWETREEEALVLVVGRSAADFSVLCPERENGRKCTGVSWRKDSKSVL